MGIIAYFKNRRAQKIYRGEMLDLSVGMESICGVSEELSERTAMRNAINALRDQSGKRLNRNRDQLKLITDGLKRISIKIGDEAAKGNSAGTVRYVSYLLSYMKRVILNAFGAVDSGLLEKELAAVEISVKNQQLERSIREAEEEIAASEKRMARLEAEQAETEIGSSRYNELQKRIGGLRDILGKISQRKEYMTTQLVQNELYENLRVEIEALDNVIGLSAFATLEEMQRAAEEYVEKKIRVEVRQEEAEIVYDGTRAEQSLENRESYGNVEFHEATNKAQGKNENTSHH